MTQNLAGGMNASDSRREQRFRFDQTVTIIPWDETGPGDARHVRLLDCSAHGLGVEDSLPMEPGKQLATHLQLDEATMVLYTVRHCVEQPSGRFRIGAQLFGFVGAAEDEPDRVLASLLQHGLSRR